MHLTNALFIHVNPPNHLVWDNKCYPCALGWGGLSADKYEGDGTTPIGCFPLRRVLYREDRVLKPNTRLPVSILKPNDGWCDDPSDEAYNQLISRPFSASHECLWREDHIYDVIVQLGYNDSPVVTGKGSAIFIHVAQPTFLSTQGCIALQHEDLLNVLKTCGPETNIFVPPPT